MDLPDISDLGDALDGCFVFIFNLALCAIVIVGIYNITKWAIN